MLVESDRCQKDWCGGGNDDSRHVETGRQRVVKTWLHRDVAEWWLVVVELMGLR